jgi:hypothetical protein
MRRIPYYLSLLDPAMDFNANTDNLFFRKRAELWDEFAIFTRRFLRKAFIAYFNSPNLFPKYKTNLILGNRFVIIIPKIQIPSKVNQGNAD